MSSLWGSESLALVDGRRLPTAARLRGRDGCERRPCVPRPRRLPLAFTKRATSGIAPYRTSTVLLMRRSRLSARPGRSAPSRLARNAPPASHTLYAGREPSGAQGSARDCDKSAISQGRFRASKPAATLGRTAAPSRATVNGRQETGLRRAARVPVEHQGCVEAAESRL